MSNLSKCRHLTNQRWHQKLAPWNASIKVFATGFTFPSLSLLPWLTPNTGYAMADPRVLKGDG